jgi:hypothetical protein
MDTNITVADLEGLKNIVDLAARRGAFHASEMAEVGAVYNKLDAFLQGVIPQTQPDQEPPKGE